MVVNSATSDDQNNQNQRDHDRDRFVQSGRQAGRASLPAEFSARHLSVVRFVVHPHQVKNAVKHQDANFVLDGMAAFTGLLPRAAEGDGDIAEWIFFARRK